MVPMTVNDDHSLMFPEDETIEGKETRRKGKRLAKNVSQAPFFSFFLC